MNPVELECIYLVSESTSELRLNHAVRSVMISGLVTFQVPSNLLKKKKIKKNECNNTREWTDIQWHCLYYL